MANKRYNEDEGGSELPQKVKGPKGSEASFGKVGADKDDEQSDINNTGVSMPSDSPKSLPKAGKTS